MKRQNGGQKARTSVSRSRLRGQWHVSSLLLLCGLLLSAPACTKAPEKPPESALKQAKQDARLMEQEELELERRHLAPPPAYGNKVVMAQHERSQAAQF